MGQAATANSPHLSLKELHDKYIIEADIPDSSCRLLRLRESGQWFMLKELTLTSNEELADTTRRLHDRQMLRHDHYLPLASFFVRSESSFCSTFHKISSLYEYGKHSLRNEVEARLQEKKKFCEKELWSILCSCCIVMAYLQKSNVEYRLISPDDIFLTDEGVVKVVDPQLAIVNRSNNARSYYAPELLTSHRDSPNSSVFSLGMTILELIFLEPLFDCYDYEGFGFNDSLFNVRIKELEKVPLSESLKQVLLKMLTSSDRQRPGIVQLEEMLYQIVESTFGENLVSAQEGVLNNRQGSTRLISTTFLEPPSTFRNIEEDIDQPAGLRQPLAVLAPEQQEVPLPPPDKVLVDLQLPDEADDKNEAVLTDRSNVLATSNSNRYLKKNAMLNDNQPTFNKEQLQAVIRFDKKENSIQTQYADTEKEPTFGTKAEKEPARFGNENLFTDPKLLELVRRDLQDINMRKSMCSAASNHDQSLNVIMPSQNQYSLNDKIQYGESLRGSVIYNMPPSRSIQSEPHESHRYSLPSGQTILTSADEQNFVVETYNKGRYEGQKKNGVRHGFGTFYYKQGGKYTGEWKDNRMDGKGTLYYYNERVAYQGEWKEDRLWGNGTLYNEEPKALHEPFDFTNWDELDEYWLRYEGGFHDDNKCGLGRYFLSNGERFEGHFQEDQLNGEGIFYSKDGRIIRGLWKSNLLIKQY